jgi:PASTA domain
MPELPDVVGQSVGEAEAVLRELGYQPSHRLTPSGTVEAGSTRPRRCSCSSAAGLRTHRRTSRRGGSSRPKTIEPPPGLVPVSDPSQEDTKDY